jgi:chemotaxis protein MotB
MKTLRLLSPFLILLLISSCVSKKKFLAITEDRNKVEDELSICERERGTLEAELAGTKNSMALRQEQMSDLRAQLEDARKLRDAQLSQVEGLTTLSQTANQNIQETLSQLEGKDKYLRYLQAAKNRTDSVNLALAVNLKSVLRDGIEDDDVEVKIDKTVVFINLSDNMLYQSGSSTITSRADEVLEKIATIIKSRPNLEVMIEGYTDNVPVTKECIDDNWDLSVRRSVAVVRALQNNHGIDPNRLIAAGRGEYNALQSNDTPEGRSANRRTRIIILPKLDQFYDLLDPEAVPE